MTRQPVVALESTIIAHGVPSPANVENALAVEQIIRNGGARTANIALIRNNACVGAEIAKTLCA